MMLNIEYNRYVCVCLARKVINNHVGNKDCGD